MSDNVKLFCFVSNCKKDAKDIEQIVVQKKYFFPKGCKKGPIHKDQWEEYVRVLKDDSQKKKLPYPKPYAIPVDVANIILKRPKMARYLVIDEQKTHEDGEGWFVYHNLSEKKTFKYKGLPIPMEPYTRYGFPVDTARHLLRNAKDAGINLVFRAGPKHDDEFLVTKEMKRNELTAVASHIGVPVRAAMSNEQLAFAIMVDIWSKKKHEHLTKADLEKILEVPSEGKESKKDSAE